MNFFIELALSLPAVDQPTPIAPPGFENINLISGWIFWIAVVAGVMGIIIFAITMVISHNRNAGFEHASKFAWILGGLILMGAASGIVNVLVPNV